MTEETVVVKNEFGFPIADHFVPKRELRSNEVKSPNQLISEWVVKNDSRGIIAYGEDGHHGGGTLEYEVELTKLLSQKGLKRIFLEEDVVQSENLDIFMRTGEISADFRTYLESGFVRGDAKSHDYKIRLLQVCRELSLNVTFVGADSDDEKWFRTINREIGKELDGLYLFIAGSNHVHKSPYTISHSGKEFKPTGYRLSETYGTDKILSIKAFTYGDQGNKAQPELSRKYFERDIATLNSHDKASAVDVRTSPYHDLLNRTDVQILMGESFDLMLSLPGDDYAKHV